MAEGQLQIPPYVPYRTFRNFVDQLREGIPARIDRSVWGARYSGSSGIQLMTTLKVLGLTDADGRPTEELERLVMTDGDERRAVLAAILQRHYRPIFTLDLARATKAQFSETFKVYGAREGVLRKCENFFIQAAQDAGIELSQYILARRHTSRRASAGSRTRQSSVAAAQPGRLEAVPAAALNSLAEMVLAKYPDFDPSWDPSVQERWLEGIGKLYESLGRPAPDSGRSPGQSSGESANNA
ncbi:MAG: DUF5343 domain-containing protein [Chloroflexi bacterium]|nr:DUF5343 domain-containing protein [Chloroflexota bacterium]